jgi:Na+/proline symporter
MAAYASGTFWPAGAIQAAVAGAIGGVIAVVAWSLAIPLVSGLIALIGGFMVVMAVYTLIQEGRKAAKSRRAGGELPPRE